jgi:hypothetical protein
LRIPFTFFARLGEDMTLYSYCADDRGFGAVIAAVLKGIFNQSFLRQR